MVSLEKIKDSIQSCNVNFLIGSGLSLPYLAILGNVESLLNDLDNVIESHDKAWKIVHKIELI